MYFSIGPGCFGIWLEKIYRRANKACKLLGYYQSSSTNMKRGCGLFVPEWYPQSLAMGYAARRWRALTLQHRHPSLMLMNLLGTKRHCTP